jgi:nicotinate-nucleotide adenylyltransferase
MLKASEQQPLVPGPGNWRGLRVGLLGGSFNPAHEGHLHISRQAMTMLKLDSVWWLVSPQNPLKDQQEMASFEDRMAGATRLAHQSGIEVISPEQRLGTNYSYEVVEALLEACPHTRFVWLMGADNMVQFPAWRNWKCICDIVPIAVFDRPGYSLAALSGEMAKSFAEHRLPVQKASSLADLEPPAWTFIRCQPNPQSATSIRKGRSAKAD